MCAGESENLQSARTSSGKPNLQGYWRSRLITAFSLEGVSKDDPLTKLAVMPWEIAPTVIVDPADGKIPYQPWAAEIGRRGVNFQKYWIRGRRAIRRGYRGWHCRTPARSCRRQTTVRCCGFTTIITSIG